MIFWRRSVPDFLFPTSAWSEGMPQLSSVCAVQMRSFLCIRRPCWLQPPFVPLVLDLRHPNKQLYQDQSSFLFLKNLSTLSRTFYWIARSTWKNLFRLMLKNLQLQNSKAKARIVHQQIYWQLLSDEGIFEYVKNVHSVPAYLYLSKTVIMVFRVYPENWRFVYRIYYISLSYKLPVQSHWYSNHQSFEIIKKFPYFSLNTSIKGKFRRKFEDWSEFSVEETVEICPECNLI